MKNKNEPWQNSRFWLQQYARGGNGAKGEAGQGRGTGWKQVGKEGAAAGGRGVGRKDCGKTVSIRAVRTRT